MLSQVDDYLDDAQGLGFSDLAALAQHTVSFAKPSGRTDAMERVDDINDYMVNMGPAEGRGMMAAERDRHTTLLTKKCF